MFQNYEKFVYVVFLKSNPSPMKLLLIALLLVFTVSCAQEKKPILGDTPFQKELNAEYKDATTSPLKKKDREHFEGLDFFAFDSAYVVKASIERTPDSKWFQMKTTTDRLSQERVYGILNFELKGTAYQLELYQGQELMTKEGFEDYLFLPFLDNTNGDSTYGGGRYIDLSIPEGDSLIVDFNTAYNPYCAYNEKYSCPIVPRRNYLNTDVTAGVKKFHKSEE